ncbi:hypothetical protein IAR55_003346 [Kwoniella newhampshirensis]|uniref:Uncharacterized protein n=1 Tax=Kwoniella newhampshirensis TaxID=1651941 RepID=A0AAW0YZ54_9TREE
MRASTSIVALATVASYAAAQTTSIASAATAALSLLSPNCQATILQLATNSSAAQCLHVDLLAGLVTSNGSLIPGVDNYLSTICSSAPCTNETLTNTTQTVLQACSSDLTNFGITNQTLEYAMELYPLAREVLCLKTSDPYTSANATMPMSANSTMSSNSTSSYNTTNGTFCATSLLTEFSSYLGTDLTTSYVTSVALGGNATALQTIESIPLSALCNECVFAALDLVEEELPFIGNISVMNTTLNGFLDGQCNSTNLTVSTNGTLPTNVTISAVNSTFTYNITAGNVTYAPNSTVLPAVAQAASSNSSALLAAATSLTSGNATSSLASAATSIVAGNSTAMKRRWIGEQ